MLCKNVFVSCKQRSVYQHTFGCFRLREHTTQLHFRLPVSEWARQGNPECVKKERSKKNSSKKVAVAQILQNMAVQKGLFNSSKKKQSYQRCDMGLMCDVRCDMLFDVSSNSTSSTGTSTGSSG